MTVAERWSTRRRNGKLPVAMRLVSAIEVDSSTGCWIWRGAINDAGYGKLHVEGRAERAHRISYQYFIGSIPEGMHLDHLCRVRGCVNPLHLEVVSPAENTRRGDAGKVQSERTKCPKGHPYNSENTRFVQGQRKCIACAKVWQAAINARRGNQSCR